MDQEQLDGTFVLTFMFYSSVDNIFVTFDMGRVLCVCGFFALFLVLVLVLFPQLNTLRVTQ